MAVDKERMKSGTRARSMAVQRLIDVHTDEFEKFHTEIRAQFGLPPSGKVATLDAQIQKTEERLAKLKAEREGHTVG